MPDKHPNVALIERLDISDVVSAAEVFAEDVVWHYFNPRLPELQGDYFGLSGIKIFFDKVRRTTGDTFRTAPISLTPMGNELVVVHTRNSLTLEDEEISTDVVVVWRIVGGHVTEVWDIPSVFTDQA